MYYAHAVNVRTERPTVRPFDSAELAARHVTMLLKLDGWPHDEKATVARLVSGETLVHKRFAYRVSSEP